MFFDLEVANTSRLFTVFLLAARSNVGDNRTKNLQSRTVGRAVMRSSLRFKSLAGQIGHSKANGLQHCDISLNEGTVTRRWVPPTRYTLRRKTTSIRM